LTTSNYFNLQMINCLKYALTILFIFALTEIHAQLKSDYVFGVNVSTLTIKNNGVNYDPKRSVGFHFGGFYEFQINKYFSLQPSFIFSAKGTDYKIDTLEVSIAPAYIEIPINASFSFGSRITKVSLFSGPYFAYAFGGYKLASGSVFKSISYGSGKNHDLRPFDFGLNLGASVKIKRYQIFVQYGIGLSNISPVRTSDKEMKNKVIGISIIRTSKSLGTKPGR
jgi:hypothetical protein